MKRTRRLNAGSLLITHDTPSRSQIEQEFTSISKSSFFETIAFAQRAFLERFTNYL
jgi:hypothetical protein